LHWLATLIGDDRPITQKSVMAVAVSRVKSSAVYRPAALVQKCVDFSHDNPAK